MDQTKVFPPNNNTERYLAAILEELRAQSAMLDRLLIVALEPAPEQPRRRGARSTAVK